MLSSNAGDSPRTSLPVLPDRVRVTSCVPLAMVPFCEEAGVEKGEQIVIESKDMEDVSK